MRFKFLVLLQFFIYTESARILSIFLHPGKSHLQIFEPLIKKLNERGHHLTVVTHFGFGIKNQGYEEIILKPEVLKGRHDIDLEDLSKPRWMIQLDNAIKLSKLGVESCRTLFKNEQVKKLLDSDEKFDLIIAEFFNTDCFFGFKEKYHVPIVGFSSLGIMPYHSDRFGIPDNPSYVPNNHMWFGDRMQFWDRLVNFLGVFWYKGVYSYHRGDNQRLADDFFGTELASLDDLSRETSLILLNSHFTFEFARPLVPNVVQVGGIHVGNVKPLPKNIEKFIEESPHGVIYFSLGSMIKGHTFPEEKRKEFLRAFARLPQRVLWKWENETMPGKPENVMIQKWMPQFDILCHPKVKAFISHGGLLGSTEAVHCGVPMVIMPQYGDQHANAKAAEANGAGVILYLNEATEESVYNSLQTVLEPSFKEKTMELSARFRDRPMSPIDTAIYWIEYVIRHKGAPHLKTAAVDMPLYQYLLLDVIAFLLLVVVLVSFIAYKILSVTIRLVVSKRKVKQS